MKVSQVYVQVDTQDKTIKADSQGLEILPSVNLYYNFKKYTS